MSGQIIAQLASLARTPPDAPPLQVVRVCCTATCSEGRPFACASTPQQPCQLSTDASQNGHWQAPSVCPFPCPFPCPLTISRLRAAALHALQHLCTLCTAFAWTEMQISRLCGSRTARAEQSKSLLYTEDQMKHIALLVSGGDGPGIRPCLFNIISTAWHYGMESLTVPHGLDGLTTATSTRLPISGQTRSATGVARSPAGVANVFSRRNAKGRQPHRFTRGA